MVGAATEDVEGVGTCGVVEARGGENRILASTFSVRLHTLWVARARDGSASPAEAREYILTERSCVLAGGALCGVERGARPLGRAHVALSLHLIVCLLEVDLVSCVGEIPGVHRTAYRISSHSRACSVLIATSTVGDTPLHDAHALEGGGAAAADQVVGPLSRARRATVRAHVRPRPRARVVVVVPRVDAARTR